MSLVENRFVHEWTETLEDLYDMIDDAGVAMMVADIDGKSRSCPMQGVLSRDTGVIWFLTDIACGLSKSIAVTPLVNVSYARPDHETFVSLSGYVSVCSDLPKIKELLCACAKHWPEDDKTQDTLQALSFRPTLAEFWPNPSLKPNQIWRARG